MGKPEKPNRSIRDIGTLLRPKNVLKTISSQVPIASAGVEMLNHLDGERVERRVAALEQTDAAVMAHLQKLEASVIKTLPPPFAEWPIAVNEYLQRNVEFAVLHTVPGKPDDEYTLPVANGCLVGDDYVLTSSEALDFVTGAVKLKRGRPVILFNLCWYDFEPEPVNDSTGLVLCKLTKRDEQTYEEARKIFRCEGVDLWVEPPVKIAPKWTITPWVGQDVGWILPSDSDDNMRLAEFTHAEFGTSVISHFRLPKHNALKVFVTAPYAGRIKQFGSPVFAHDGSLLGIISDVEQYEFDVGRRAVVKSLLGFPRFTIPKLKPSGS